jgi:NTP pyrophosphatase (non-canonical NTP hydrolase)
MNLNEAAQNAFETARQRERNGANVNINHILKHCAGEVIEAATAREFMITQDYGNTQHYGEELADVIICALIAAYKDGVDIEKAVKEKLQINAQRAAMQGDKL